MANNSLLNEIIKGLLTYVPGLRYIIAKKKIKSYHSGANAEFCYNLWLRILIQFNEIEKNPNLKNVGEVGTGGSLGVGICALLTGSEKFYALEIENKFSIEQNLQIFDELLQLFTNRTRLSDKYNQLNSKVDSLQYPEDIIKPMFLEENFINEIRSDFQNALINSNKIKIIQNWESHPSLKLDLIYSRAVMEHVSNPYKVYEGIWFHLNTKSYTYHDIEFHSHGLTKKIDGHLGIPEYLWKIIQGKRSYYLNRWELENHNSSILRTGFHIIRIEKTYMNDYKDFQKKLYGAVIIAKKLLNNNLLL